MIFDDLCHFVTSKDGSVKDRVMSFTFDGIHLFMNLDKEDKYLYIYSQIASTKAVHNEDCLLWISKENLELCDTESGHLGISPDSDCLVYSQRLEFQLLNDFELSTAVAIFKRVFTELKEKFSKLNEDKPVETKIVENKPFDMNNALFL